MRRIGRLGHLVAALALLSATACKAPESDATLTSVTVAAPATTLESGQTLQLTATAHYSDGKSAALTSGVTWSSSRPTVATVDASGLVTGAGTATDATVISAAFGGKSGTAALTVTYVLKSIAIDGPAAPLPAGFDARLGVTGTWSGSVEVPVTSGVAWESLDAAIATVGADGRVHGVSVGVATITATWGGQTATLELEVNGATLDAIAVQPPSATVELGGTVQLSATGTFTDSIARPLPSDAVVWTCPDATPKASVTTSGLATGSAVGSATLRATDSATGVHGDATLTIVPPTLVSLSLAPSSGTVPAGRTVQFVATGVFSDGSRTLQPESVSWAAADGAGVMDGRAWGTKSGTFKVTASYGGKLATATLTVTAPVVDAVVVTPPASVVAPGGTQKFRAEAAYSDGTTYIWASWTSAPTEIATVVGYSGVTTAVAAGTATITAAIGVTQGTATLVVAAPGVPASLDGSLAHPASFPYTGSLPSFGAEAYEVTGLTAGERYLATLSGVEGDAAVAFYVDAAMSQPLCQGGAVPDVAAPCVFTAPSATVYAALDTADALGTAYTLDVATLGLLGATHWPTWYAMAGAVLAGSDGTEYRVAGLVPGTRYTVSLLNPSAPADLYVFEDGAFQQLTCVSAAAGLLAETCDVVAPATGMIYLLVYCGNPVSQVFFDVDVVPTDVAVRHVSFPDAVPYAGSVGTGTTVHLVNGLVPGTQYAVSLTDLYADPSLRVYGDAALTELLCSSSNAGTSRERCVATAPADGTLHVVADGAGTVAGLAYRLDVTLPGPLGTDITVLAATTDLPLTGGSGDRYALTGLQPLTSYTIRATKTDGGVAVSVYADATMTVVTCNDDNWGTSAAQCGGTTDAAGTIYVTVGVSTGPSGFKLEAL